VQLSHGRCGDSTAQLDAHVLSATEALRTRRVGRVTLAAHGVLLARTRCEFTGEHAQLIAELQVLINLQVADCEMHELLGDSQHSLGVNKNKDSYLMAAERAYESAYKYGSPLITLITLDYLDYESAYKYGSPFDGP
jgi:hypothetical protein